MPFGVAPSVRTHSICRDGSSGYSGYPSSRRPLPLKYSSGLPSTPVLDKYWHNRLLPLRPDVQIAYPRLAGSAVSVISAETLPRQPPMLVEQGEFFVATDLVHIRRLAHALTLAYNARCGSGVAHDLSPAVRRNVGDLYLSHRQPARRRGADHR